MRHLHRVSYFVGISLITSKDTPFTLDNCIASAQLVTNYTYQIPANYLNILSSQPKMLTRKNISLNASVADYSSVFQIAYNRAIINLETVNSSISIQNFTYIIYLETELFNCEESYLTIGYLEASVTKMRYL
jgi:hypothetical protein